MKHSILTATAMLAVCGLVFPSERAEPGTPIDGPIVLEIYEGFGRALFRECFQTVVLNPDSNQNSAFLRCALADGLATEPRWLFQDTVLSGDETQTILNTLKSLDSFRVQREGKDQRPTDGRLQTITFIIEGKATSVVTSGNPAFVEPGPGYDLIVILGSVQRRQVESWRDNQ